MRPGSGGEVLGEVGVPAAEEVSGADNRESHGVLPPVGDPLGFVVIDTEDAVVGYHVQGAVGGVDPEAVNVADSPLVSR